MGGSTTGPSFVFRISVFLWVPEAGPVSVCILFPHARRHRLFPGAKEKAASLSFHPPDPANAPLHRTGAPTWAGWFHPPDPANVPQQPSSHKQPTVRQSSVMPYPRFHPQAPSRSAEGHGEPYKRSGRTSGIDSVSAPPAGICRSFPL